MDLAEPAARPVVQGSEAAAAQSAEAQKPAPAEEDPFNLDAMEARLHAEPLPSSEPARKCVTTSCHARAPSKGQK